MSLSPCSQRTNASVDLPLYTIGQSALRGYSAELCVAPHLLVLQTSCNAQRACPARGTRVLHASLQARVHLSAANHVKSAWWSAYLYGTKQVRLAVQNGHSQPDCLSRVLCALPQLLLDKALLCERLRL